MPFNESLIQKKLELLLNCFYAFTSKEICSSLFFDTCNSSHCTDSPCKNQKPSIHQKKIQSNVNCILSMTPIYQTYGITLELSKPQGNLITEKTASISNEVHYQSSFQASGKLKPSAHDKKTLLLIHLLCQGLDFFV